MPKFHLLALLATMVTAGSIQAATPIPLADFAKHEKFDEVKISPDGKYLAASAVVDGKRVLSLINLSDNKGLTVRPREDDEVVTFWWVSPTRVLYSVGQRTGGLEQPIPTGELFAVDADGKGNDLLFGFRARENNAGATATHIKRKENEYASAWMLDTLRNDDDIALVQVQRWNTGPIGGESLPNEVRRIDVRSGRMKTIAVGPVRDARFVTDNNGAVRFAYGEDAAQKLKVYYREADGKDWELVFDQAAKGSRAFPLAFNRAGDAVYFDCSDLCKWDVAKRTMESIWSGKDGELTSLARTFDDQDVFAVRSMPGRAAVSLIDKAAAESKLLVELMKQFPGEAVQFVSWTLDGKRVVVLVYSDLNPGVFYLYDRDSKKLDLLLARMPWIKPDALATMEPFKFEARDGVALEGYLSRPFGKEEAKNLPLVVYVHGGPYGERDTWGYDAAVQALASRGYAVLQVNYRGSGGHGYAFVRSGYREWGAKMQDDVTDATSWAIKQGVADPKRICIYGSSYGGYAALQGAVREPDMYQCAIGSVGVYDLNLMKSRGDIPQSASGDNYLSMVLGDDATVLAQRSPVNQLDRLKAKVMLIVGGQDKRVPPVHGESMRGALAVRGIKAEWLYQRTESHGFYDEANVADMYEKIIAFLDANIGTKN